MQAKTEIISFPGHLRKPLTVVETLVCFWCKLCFIFPCFCSMNLDHFSNYFFQFTVSHATKAPWHQHNLSSVGLTSINYLTCFFTWSSLFVTKNLQALQIAIGHKYSSLSTKLLSIKLLQVKNHTLQQDFSLSLSHMFINVKFNLHIGTKINPY